MTGRYFYRDPLAAAWMAKHHEIKFANGDSLRSACEAVGMYGRDMSNGGGFYIHPDSLHLLEPQVGDVLYSKIKDGISVEELISDERAAQTGPHIIQRGGRIIQRNGVAFHWPESEAA